jgi:DivIVA domain-containing protein
MALDRSSIARTDFPLVRRGYDRATVDAHLQRLADDVEALRRGSVGSAASAQVQSILDAAEATAAEIEQRAWEEAARVQAAADDSLARARERVHALSQAADAIRARIDELLQEVSTLEATLEPLPEETVEALADEIASVPTADVLPPDEETVEVPRFERAEEGEPDADPGRRTGWFAQGPPAWTPPAAEQPGEDEPATNGEDVDGARLVALNMALSGQSREETDRYLAEHYRLSDRAALLDEVYSTLRQ